MNSIPTWSLATLVALAATTTVPAQQNAGSSQLGSSQLGELGAKARSIVDTHAGAVVTVHVVIKVEFSGQSREHRLEARGTLVTDTGLVMTDDGTVTPQVNVQSNGRAIQGVKTELQDIKVVFGKEEEEQASFLVGKDSKLGLAFLQVRDFDPKKRSIQIPDYGKATDPAVGDIVVSPNRLEKGFDYAPYFAFGWVIGEIKKPLKCLLLSSGANAGLPAFNLAGQLVGAHSQLRPGVGQGKPRAVMLSGGVVNGAIRQAEKRGQKMLEEQKDGDEPAATDADK
jgi:hypothetical protein